MRMEWLVFVVGIEDVETLLHHNSEAAMQIKQLGCGFNINVDYSRFEEIKTFEGHWKAS